MIELTLNGTLITIKRCSSLSEALDELGYAKEKIAIAINNEFIPRSYYQDQRLVSGDSIEILSPMQGG